ncbi:PTS fructose transporter subunit IIABC [Mesomycoplasma molare]|uniref:Fructose-specific PTS transporter subunit EIIC n=1 Tax=Mesomycoplasma molare TaxID=171288 RepID=A0ABY5TUL5_9BACT|nr:fructose-specific PTS transporter subunit EIIC [Mesomycoplasma molare]UWD34354.1 fructose-specific PTS transporter subunit EIIC [Mesomycoplasma molare]
MNIFSKDYIFINETFKAKDDVFKFIAKKAFELKVTLSEKDVYDALLERESQVSTGMEKEFAIPHAQSEAINKPILLFIKSSEGLEWETFDNSKVKYMISILVPKNSKENIHLETLSKVSTMLSDADLIEKLKKLEDKEEIYNLFNNFLENKEAKQVNKTGKKVVGITSCAVGIAHTYLSAENLEKKLIAMGYEPKIETRGSVGPKNTLSSKDIEEAEFVIIASDVKIDLAKFNNKKLYSTSTKEAIHNTEEVIKKAENAPIFKQSSNSFKKEETKDKKGVLKHIVTGISYMIPFVIFGGILIALSLGIGKSVYGSDSAAPKGDFLWWLLEIGVVSFTVMIGILGAYIAYSIAGRAAIMPAFVVSMVANNKGLFYNIGNIEVQTPMGFIGAVLFGILVGYTVKWIASFKIQKSVSAVIPMFIIPIGVTLFYSLLVVFVVGAPIGWVMDKFINSLKSLFENKNGSLNIGIALLIGALLGGMAGFDMGGPINKVAFLTSTALVSEQIFEPMGMVGAAIPVAPLGMGLTTLIFRKKFTNEEKTLGASALFMGFIGISEGAIPFAVADPKRVITANVVGSAVAGALAGLLSVTNAAAHGGPIVAILGAVGSKVHGTGLGILYFFLAVIAGTITTTLIYGFWKGKNVLEEVNIPFVKSFRNKINLRKGAKNGK